MNKLEQELLAQVVKTQELKKAELIAANKAAANEILFRIQQQLNSQVYKITQGNNA